MFETRKAVLLDMDGVIVLGPAAAPGALAFLDRFGSQVCLVSNDSSLTPKGLSKYLSGLSIRITADRIILAGATSIEILMREIPGRRIRILGASSLQSLAKDAGVQLVPIGEQPDVVLLGRDPEFNVSALEEVVRAIEDGADLWVTNPDLRHPIEDGRYTYQTGALLQSILACVGEIPYRIIGKPKPILFEEALRIMHAQPEEAVMIGDNPSTDGVGAASADIPFILLGPSPEAKAANLEELLLKFENKTLDHFIP